MICVLDNLCRFFETRIVTVVEEPFEFAYFAGWNWTGAEERQDQMDSKKMENEFPYPEGNLINGFCVPKYFTYFLVTQKVLGQVKYKKKIANQSLGHHLSCQLCVMTQTISGRNIGYW